MHELKLFVLISWISLPTVMFGGYSLLPIGGKLTPQQYGLFRAGHAHADRAATPAGRAFDFVVAK